MVPQGQETSIQPGLGWLVPVAVVAGLVIIGSTVVKTTKLITDAKNEETELTRHAMKIDREMAEKPTAVRSAWERFKKTVPSWKKLKEMGGLSGFFSGAGILITAGLLLFAFGRQRSN